MSAKTRSSSAATDRDFMKWGQRQWDLRKHPADSEPFTKEKIDNFVTSLEKRLVKPTTVDERGNASAERHSKTRAWKRRILIAWYKVVEEIVLSRTDLLPCTGEGQGSSSSSAPATGRKAI